MNAKRGQGKKLRMLFAQFALKGKDVAEALALDPGLVSKWLNGKRMLRIDSGNMERMIDFLLSCELTQARISWLRETLREDGISSEFGSSADFKLGLTLWLADENDPSIRFLAARIANDEQSDVSSEKYRFPGNEGVRVTRREFVCRVGAEEISMQLSAMLEDCSGFIDIHLSSEDAAAVVAPPIRNALETAMRQGKKMRMLAAVSGRTDAGLRLLPAYLIDVLESRISLYLEHNAGTSALAQTTLHVPGRGVIAITELPGAQAPLAASVITEPSYTELASERLNHIFGYAKPVFSPLRDVSTRRVQQMLLEDYESPGDIIILRSALSPYYMEIAYFEKLLRSLGYAGEGLQWRLQAFERNRHALLAGLSQNLSITELIPERCFLSVTSGEGAAQFRINGDALMEPGCRDVEPGFLAAVAEGYLHVLNEYPSLHVRIVEDEAGLPQNAELVLKSGAGHLILRRNDEIQPLLYSEEYVILQSVYDMLQKLSKNADRGRYGVGSVTATNQLIHTSQMR